MKKIIVLGCTGSIGTTALSMLQSMKESIHVEGLSSNLRYGKMLSIAREFSCSCIETPVIDPAFEAQCRSLGIDLYHSAEEMVSSCEADLVLNGISGAKGLEASIIALSSGKDLALANKESMVMAGPLLKALARKHGRRIIPVDSEHSAIYELVKAFGADSIRKLIITASGGPFRCASRESLFAVTPLQAAHHPTWNMGPKISIDCATLANKALEVIEAGMLFDVASESIVTVIHPQSSVHSLVTLKNGQTYGQISQPSMKFPILNAILDSFGMKIDTPLCTPLLELGEELHLDFYPMDFKRFPMVKYGYECLSRGSFWPILFNASNEVAVDAFRRGRIRFNQIEEIVGRTLEECRFTGSPSSFEDVWNYDGLSRKLALKMI